MLTYNDTVVGDKGILGNDAGPAVPAGAGVVKVNRDVRGGLVDGDRRRDGEECVHGRRTGDVRRGMRARARSVAGRQSRKRREAGAGQRTRYAEVVNDFAVKPHLLHRVYMPLKPCSCHGGHQCAHSYCSSASDRAHRAEPFGPASCLHGAPYKTIKRTIAPERTAPSFTLLMRPCCLCPVSSVKPILLKLGARCAPDGETIGHTALLPARPHFRARAGCAWRWAGIWGERAMGAH